MSDMNGFNPNEHEPSRSFDPIPAGKYLVVITESEKKPTKAGDDMFVFTMEVIEGKYKGRMLWSRLVVGHTDPKTSEIAKRQLGDICRAVEVMAPKDSVELHNLPLVVSVKIVERKDTGDLTNEVRGFSAVKDAKPAAAPAPAAPAAPPWRRNR